MAAPRVSQRAAIERAVALPRPGCHGTVFIGIDGFGASGKSTFASRLADRRPGTVVVHVDDFAAPGVPEWDWQRFRAQLLTPLLAGRPARFQRWDWRCDEGAEWHDIPLGRTVIVEGVSATRCEIDAPWALTVWVDAPRDVRLARARERDGEHMLATWVERWLPEEEAWAARTDPVGRVDLIVDGTEPLSCRR